jgi:hypothetical protein
MSIYDKNKVLFLPFTTKKADNAKIPALVPNECDIFKCCASYIQDDFENWDAKIPVAEEPKREIKVKKDDDDDVDDENPDKYNRLSALIKRLKEINIGSINQSSMKLLMDVIGADNEITKSEMKLINSIGKELGINVKDIQAMTDKAFLEMKGGSELDETMDSMIVINPEWTKAEIKDYLNKEFTKWNGRIQALEDEEEKNKAQAMLDAIAKARKKYAK